MSCRTFNNRNRKEQSKPKNIASAEISRLMLERLKKDPEKFVNKLFQIFEKKDSVNAAILIVKLADGYTLPEPKETGPRKMSLIEKWLSEPEWTPEIEAETSKATDSAAAAEPQPETATETATEAPAAAPAASGVASEIGLAPNSANNRQWWEPGGSSGPRPCRNPISAPGQSGASSGRVPQVPAVGDLG